MSGVVTAAILGPGNIGTDLMIKLLRSQSMDVALMVGIYEDSPGLERARQHGVEASAAGLAAVLERDDIELVFDATSAQSHAESAPRLRDAGKRVVDLTPAAVGPYVVPSVNLDRHLDEPNVNMVSCGGQATIPFVHAVNRVGPVKYAEIVATISSRSAGQGTRQNIDEFTVTTAAGIERVGGADRGKAIIILNPAEPPILMRDTIFAVVEEPDEAAIRESVSEMADDLRGHVPGLRLLFVDVDGDRVTIMVEIAGAGDFLPTYAGNLDIMTAAAARVGEGIAEARVRA
ncbi:MAG: acetaldehyde dehydrogenase (acetylating) [Thermoleophilaceae bacterium]